jgi:hydrogenase nickel incorporation protein HypA/HybF
MHELAIIGQIIDSVTEKLECEPNRDQLQVDRVVLEIGKLSGVFQDAIRFGFDVCTRGTLLENAALEIIEYPGTGSCRRCNARIESDQPYIICACGSAEIAWQTGHELRIKNVEVRKCARPVVAQQALGI